MSYTVFNLTTSRLSEGAGYQILDVRGEVHNMKFFIVKIFNILTIDDIAVKI